MSIKQFLSATAAVEGATGAALLAAPSPVASLLLGASLALPVALVVARVAGAGLLALGLGCWLGRNDSFSAALRGLLFAMLLYNACTVLVLLHARLELDLSGPGLWPALVLHLAMSAWGIACLGWKKAGARTDPPSTL